MPDTVELRDDHTSLLERIASDLDVAARDVDDITVDLLHSMDDLDDDVDWPVWAAELESDCGNELREIARKIEWIIARGRAGDERT